VSVDTADLKELVALAKKWNGIPLPESNLMQFDPTHRRRLYYKEGDYRCNCYKPLMTNLRRVLAEKTIALNYMLDVSNRAIVTGYVTEATPKHQLAFKYPSITLTLYNSN